MSTVRVGHFEFKQVSRRVIGGFLATEGSPLHPRKSIRFDLVLPFLSFLNEDELFQVVVVGGLQAFLATHDMEPLPVYFIPASKAPSMHDSIISNTHTHVHFSLDASITIYLS